MLQIDNRTRLLRVFFDNPLPKGIGFQLRELSRISGIALPSVKKYLLELEREALVNVNKHRIHGYPVYLANRDGDYFKFIKKIETLKMIKESGLLDFLREKCFPEVIILFGSAARGEDLKESDLDIFLICKEKKLDLSQYEKIVGRRINLLMNNNFAKLSGELKNNILNGIIMKGYLKVY